MADNKKNHSIKTAAVAAKIKEMGDTCVADLLAQMAGWPPYAKAIVLDYSWRKMAETWSVEAGKSDDK